MTADVRLEAANGRLLLLWTPHTRGVPFGAPPPPQRKVLLEGVGRLQISYAAKETPGTWVSSWRQPVLPSLVRLRLISANGVEAWPPIIARPPREQAEQ
jgi:hypothetical protein